MAMPFIRYGERDKIEALVIKQLEDCETRLARMKAVLELKGKLIPRGSSLMIEGFIQFGETEKAWLTVLLDDTRSGRLFEAPQMSSEQIEAYIRSLEE